MAKPKAKQKEKRTEALIFRVTQAQLQSVRREAETFQMEPNAYARLKVLGGSVRVRQISELPPAITFELGRIGVNLNQIARRLNMTGECELEELATACERLEELLGVILSAVND